MNSLTYSSVENVDTIFTSAGGSGFHPVTACCNLENDLRRFRKGDATPFHLILISILLSVVYSSTVNFFESQNTNS